MLLWAVWCVNTNLYASKLLKALPVGGQLYRCMLHCFWALKNRLMQLIACMMLGSLACFTQILFCLLHFVWTACKQAMTTCQHW
jgi:hypothetical protein